MVGTVYIRKPWERSPLCEVADGPHQHKHRRKEPPKALAVGRRQPTHTIHSNLNNNIKNAKIPNLLTQYQGFQGHNRNMQKKTSRKNRIFSLHKEIISLHPKKSTLAAAECKCQSAQHSNRKARVRMERRELEGRSPARKP